MIHTCEKCGGITGHNAHKVANTLQMTGQRVFACQGHPEPSLRDAQFAGFAARLNKEINDLACSFTTGTYPGHETLQQLIEEVMARRAYDLVAHTMKYLDDHPSIEDCLSHPNEPISYIPDMPTWPEEAE